MTKKKTPKSEEILKETASGSTIHFYKESNNRYVIQDVEKFKKKETTVKLMPKQGKSKKGEDGLESLNFIKLKFK